MNPSDTRTCIKTQPAQIKPVACVKSRTKFEFLDTSQTLTSIHIWRVPAQPHCAQEARLESPPGRKKAHWKALCLAEKVCEECEKIKILNLSKNREDKFRQSGGGEKYVYTYVRIRTGGTREGRVAEATAWPQPGAGGHYCGTRAGRPPCVLGARAGQLIPSEQAGGCV
jgi:hypothetical protein